MAPRKRAYEGDLNFSLHGASDICILTVCVSPGYRTRWQGTEKGRKSRQNDVLMPHLKTHFPDCVSTSSSNPKLQAGELKMLLSCIIGNVGSSIF